MKPSSAESTNPLGLNLDFMFGRGYLWANRERLSDWITLESLRMEIPDLSFPFDARGGLDRFRNTRCLVREIEFAISEVGLGDLLRQAGEHLDRFEDLQVRFLDDAVHLSVRVRAFGSDTYVSFRAALIPPEPARADEIHLSLYDYRAFGPLPFPARLVAFELMTGLLNTPLLRPPGRGQSFTVGVAGDILSLRPLKLLLLHIFPRVGWKLPNLSGVLLEGARIRPGVLTIRATSRDEDYHQKASKNYQLSGTREGASALAAYEAKDLFANADQALFDGQIRQAMELLAGYRDIYGLHSELASRALDCLVADPSPSHLAEAEAICRELQAEEPGDLRALLVRPTLALVSGHNSFSASADVSANTEEVVEAYDALADALSERGDTADWILCQLAASQHLAGNAPKEAAARLREVLKVSPRNRIALEALQDLYTRLGEQPGLEEVLKRLTGVYTDRDTLKDTYLRLARHLMDREGELAEARLYLEKVLRLAPTELEALDTLGESYVLSGEPLRALKAFGSAARAAEANDKPRQASRLLFRVAKLWREELGDTGQALLSCRRALSMWQPSDQAKLKLEHADLLEFAARLCEERERLEEATDYWMEAIPVLEELFERAPSRSSAQSGTDSVEGRAVETFEARLIEAHEELASLYERRDRPQAGASHLRRVIELDPEHPSAADRLEQFYRQSGRPEQLIELYLDLDRRTHAPQRSLDIALKLAELYESLHLADEAADQFERALEIDPSAREPRERLLDLLHSEGQFERLRQTIERIRSRSRDAQVRRDLSLALGEVLFEELDEYANAARAFFEAVQIESTDLVALRRLVAALEKLIERDGLGAPAPAGSGTVDRLLERVLMKTAELEPRPVDQGYAFERLASLADKRGDEASAEESRRRAESAFSRASRDEAEDVDRRLDELLEEMGAGGLSAGDLLTEQSSPEPPAPDKPAPTDRGERSTMKLPAPSEIMRPKHGSTGEQARQDDTDTVEFELGTPQKPQPPQEPEESRLSGFRERYRELFTERPATRRVGEELPEPADETPTGEAPTDDRPSADQEPASLRDALEAARATEDSGQLAEAISALVAAHLDPGDEFSVEEAELLRLSLELGELYYYEIEDAEAARPHLERVRKRDPNGLGARPVVLTTLEAIYEESGDVGQRIRLLESRLENADTEEMATTYRLLLAQLVWDERQDVEKARAWLDEVLDSDPNQESAHRLLSQMARDQGDFDAAAKHLRVVLKVAGGGLDAVELERELANLLLKELDRPQAAKIHFEQVLDAAPGDSMALEGIKNCQAATDDWRGYIDSLGHELGLLIGKPEGLGLDEMLGVRAEDLSPALRVPASQIVADAAHIAEENLEDIQAARGLWGMAFSLWPEHVDALERRIALDRRLDKEEDLAEDLESYAELLLDVHARFEALTEAAALHAGPLERPDRARPLYAEAIALVHDEATPPDGLDKARRALRALQADHDG
ncbi:MAG: hypothetical protein ACLFVJ_12575 [Persicimonas sp.]